MTYEHSLKDKTNIIIEVVHCMSLKTKQRIMIEAGKRVILVEKVSN